MPGSEDHTSASFARPAAFVFDCGAFLLLEKHCFAHRLNQVRAADFPFARFGQLEFQSLLLLKPRHSHNPAFLIRGGQFATGPIPFGTRPPGKTVLSIVQWLDSSLDKAYRSLVMQPASPPDAVLTSRDAYSL